MNKIIRRNKTKEITKTVLSICAAGGLTLLVSGAVRTPDKAKKLAEALGKYSSSRIKQCLKRLSMQNFIQYDPRDLTKPICITKNGLERISFLTLKDKINNFSAKKWDHIWRLVTFDIKEKQKNKRDNFRNKIKSLGLYQLQKNIFITPFPIEKELENIVNESYLQNKVLILHVASLGKFEDTVRHHFFNPKNNINISSKN